MIHLKLADTQFPFKGFTHKRLIARAILLDQNGNICLHYLHRDDVFGNQWYYETPGGGIEANESIEEGLKRECLEETGCVIEIIACLGVIEDAYNLIGRKNENHYYLCRVLEKGDPHFASSGDDLIVKTLFVPIDDAITLMSSQSDDLVSGLVKARELPILEEAKRFFEGKNKNKGN